ncbi:BRE1 E3 ubiquitin ligase-domain-containing protein [Delphinella strobiligena]|nr:BRE1 E3 ubiquitin ligase-domain-containing protein [Delphinella strobiligena]
MPLVDVSHIKMDDRKRSIAETDEYPSKRQATAVNGHVRMSDPDKEKDIENFQKDAILRQMREYKRERNLYESQVSELTKRSQHHDDHLRVIDAWFTQLLDEIRIVVGDMVSSTPSGQEIFRSSLQFESHDAFQEHLKDRSAKIRDAIKHIFARLPTTTPEVKELQERLAALLATEKAHVVETQRIIGERDQLTERLEAASVRYLMAEKRMDRAKSAAVQKLESQAMMGGNSDAAKVGERKSSKAVDSAETNGDVDSATRAAFDTARKEALAAAEKRKLQTEQLEAENKRLTEDLTAARTKLVSCTDEDYAKTDLYKLLKSQHEDVIKRINDLEATNVQLREEAQKLQGERTAFRTQLEDEARVVQSDLESQLARAETDLARVRHARDELQGDVNVRNAQQDQQSLTVEQAKELADASQNRIAALESEVQRLRLQLGEGTAASATSVDDLDPEALKAKELPSMEAAWRKTQALATKKVADIAAWEEQRSRLLSEKAKADQKYYSAAKSKESRESELRMLRLQNSKSTEVVTQLRDSESNSRALVANLEKQLAESKESLSNLSQQNRSLQQKMSESNITLEGLKTEDSTAQTAASSKRHAEVELEQLKVRLEDTKKAFESLKRKNAGKGSSDGSDDWRHIAICPVCNSNIRNHMLKTCGHVFCHDCIDNLIKNRNRKCPSCGKAFGNGDHMPIHLA